MKSERELRDHLQSRSNTKNNKAGIYLLLSLYPTINKIFLVFDYMLIENYILRSTKDQKSISRTTYYLILEFNKQENNEWQELLVWFHQLFPPSNDSSTAERTNLPSLGLHPARPGPSKVKFSLLPQPTVILWMMASSPVSEMMQTKLPRFLHTMKATIQSSSYLE